MSDNVFKGKYLTVNASAKYPFQGYFGYQGTWQNTTKVSVVILKKEDCRDDWKSTVGEYHQSKLDALHVLKIVGYEEDSDWRYFAFQPYAVTLYEYVNSPEKYKGLALPSDLVVLYQIISAVHFLHDIEIVHGDLNPLTICIESHNSETSLMVSARIKVRESFNVNNENIFKYEEHAGNEQQLEDLKICNSKYWRRAERIGCQPEYGDDIFSVGCLLYYFIKGQHPFADYPFVIEYSNEETILENIRNKKPTHFLNAETKIKEHFAYKYIKKMILPENGTYDWLRDFRQTKIAFKNALPLKIDFKELLGKGAFGYVYKGTYEGKDVAVKVVDKMNEKQRREYDEHLRLTHENVVKLLHVQDSKDGLQTYLVLELGIATLANYFKKKKEGLPDLPENKVHFLYQLVVGLHYIHNCNLVHRDLKPDNILVFLEENSFCLKIADFGLCKKTDEDGEFSQNKNTVKVGDSIALAPERIIAKEDAKKRNETDENKLKDAGTRFSDIFELAIVLYYIFTGGQHPFQNEGIHKKIESNILNKNNKGGPVHLNKELEQHKNDISSLEYKIFNLIKGMLAHEAKNRTPLPIVIEDLTKMLGLCDNRKYQKLESFFTFFDYDFHPRQPVLALVAADNKKLVLYSAENNSIPLSNWKKTKEIEFDFEEICKVDEKILSVKWNCDGTLLAAVRQLKGHGFIVNVWSYQHNGARLSHNFLFQKIIPDVLFEFEIKEFEFAIEWNPYSPNEFAVLNSILELEAGFPDIPSFSEIMSITPVYTDALLRPFCRKRNNKLYPFNATSMDHSEINIGESMSKRKLIWISEELIIFITGFINIYSNKNGRLLKSLEIFEREVNGASQSEKKLEQLYVDVVDCVWDKKTQCLAICYEKRIAILSLGPNGLLEPLHEWTNPDGEKDFTALAWLPDSNQPNDENIETARNSPDNFILYCSTMNNSKKEMLKWTYIWTPLKEPTIETTIEIRNLLCPELVYGALSSSPSDGKCPVFFAEPNYSACIVHKTRTSTKGRVPWRTPWLPGGLEDFMGIGPCIFVSITS